MHTSTGIRHRALVTVNSFRRSITCAARNMTQSGK